ncbi:MAG: amidohydrolase family protein [Asgard group archaeon]|nr:amidohydrolase family protein [Asgard group archaeon]
MTMDDDVKSTNGFEHIKFKYSGPKWDAHVHLYKIEDTFDLVKYAKEYNVEKFTSIVREDWKVYEKEFPNTFTYARFIMSQNLFSGDIKHVLDDVQLIHDDGYPIAKFWYAPRWRNYVEEQFKANIKGFRIDSPQLDPIFGKIEDLGLKMIFHIADPDIFYETKYQPASFYGTKDQHLEELENILKRHPNLKIQVAHMAGQPEHLDRLGDWLDKYPNLYVDCSSAKWMAREFSYDPEASREFFITFQDRIFFGTDIVTGRTDREPIPGYYYLRYLSLQALLETDVRDLPLPLEDPENDNKTVINGLDLPMSVLRKIYWENSSKYFS